MHIDWNSSSGALMINPRMPKEHFLAATTKLPRLGEFADMLWLATSGSTSQQMKGLKCVALTKSAFLACAAAVNTHLHSDHNDVWLNPLPLFHVGGLAIYARSFLSHAVVARFDQQWNPQAFITVANQHQATLSALVPTQIFDLVAASLAAPKSLRAIIVGGGHLSRDLYQKALELGWPLLPSYGLTEAASQVATALLDSDKGVAPKLKILNHISVAISSTQQIMLKGPSLLSFYAFVNSDCCEVIDPKKDGWLTTEDRGEIAGQFLVIKGRSSDFVKIGGECVNLLLLEELFETLKIKAAIRQDTALVAMPDQRLGHVIHLAVAGPACAELEKVITTFHDKVMPFEKIRKIHYRQSLPRSPLNKLLRSELLQQLQSNH